MPSITRRTVTLGGLGLTLAPAAAVEAFMSAEGAPNGARVAREALWFVDPELRPAARLALQRTAAYEDADESMLPQVRASYDAAAPKPLPDVPVSKRSVPGTSGAPDVTVYVINAKSGDRRGGILHTHGGGFVVGSALGAVNELQQLASTLNCGIVTVDYRLAPETTWRGSVEDAYAGLRWMHDQAAEIGVDPARIGVMGDSAGGGLAALVAIAARDRGEIPLAFQALVYPMLDDRTGTTRPVPKPIGTIDWTAKLNYLGWRSFLGQEPGVASVPAAAVPARAASLAGLPPTFIGVGSIDLFVQEDIDYARRLIEAAVPTQLVVVPGAFHSFDNAPRTTSVAQRFHATKIEALRRALMEKPDA